MALLTIKHFLFALVALFGCSSPDVLPDEFQVGYGYGWQADTQAPHFFREGDGWNFEHGETQQVHAALTWHLGPRKVELVEPIFVPVMQEPTPVPVAEHTHNHDVEVSIKEGIQTFTTMDLASRILVVILILWLSWVYRGPISRLIPRFGNGPNGQKKK